MLIKFEIDSTQPLDTETKTYYRAAAAFFLHVIGDLEETAVPEGTTKPVPAPPPPALVSNVVNFPVPPPPPPPPIPDSAMVSASVPEPPAPMNLTSVPPPPPAVPAIIVNAAGAVGTSTSQSATVILGASTADEYDSAGLPWDIRIHQKGKSVKKDGTWKLRKLVGATPAQITQFDALTQQVVRELAPRMRGGTAAAPNLSSVPPPPPPVSLPTSGVPLPPPPSAAAFNNVPAPPPPPPVPVPNGATAGGIPAGAAPITPFRELIDKITSATQQGKLSPTQVSSLCIHHGAPNLMELNKRPDLVPAVSATMDKIHAGATVEMILQGLA